MTWHYGSIKIVSVLVLLVLGFLIFAPAVSVTAQGFSGSGGFIPLDDWVSTAVNWMSRNFYTFFDAIAMIVESVNNFMMTILTFGGWNNSGTFQVNIGGAGVIFPLLSGVAFLIMWRLSGNISTGILGLVTLWLSANFGYWPETLETFSLTFTSALIALILGIPTGIVAALNDTADTLIRPVLDMMQTMPVFVYLIPAVLFFGIGPAPGAVATIIFAYPPSVRLTNLGIRGVPTELIEAGESFGCNRLQLLMKVQLPVARPNIMAGVNQTIMLALSMAVVAGLVGAGGLGGVVVRGIQRMRVGQGFVGGLAVVFVAMILDRSTSNIGKGKKSEST